MKKNQIRKNSSHTPFLSLSSTPIVILLFFVGIDLLYIHTNLIALKKQMFFQSGQVPKTMPVSLNETIKTCPQPCRTEIQEIANAVETKISSLQQLEKKSQPSFTSNVKEFYVSFGSGSGSSGDWQDVSGLEASIDKSSYPSIRAVQFEATVLIPTGNETAYVRLYNVTDNHPVWKSDVSIEGGQAKLLTSVPITLDSGNKLYRVQMKTSLKYEAKIQQARIHIFLK